MPRNAAQKKAIAALNVPVLLSFLKYYEKNDEYFCHFASKEAYQVLALILEQHHFEQPNFQATETPNWYKVAPSFFMKYAPSMKNHDVVVHEAGRVHHLR